MGDFFLFGIELLLLMGDFFLFGIELLLLMGDFLLLELNQRPLPSVNMWLLGIEPKISRSIVNGNDTVRRKHNNQTICIAILLFPYESKDYLACLTC
jgi:hypothetical protein